MPQTTGSRRQPHMELIALRINTGLSREDMALKTGLGRETLRMAEAGFVPSPRVQFTIATTFNKLPLDLWPIERQRRPGKRRVLKPNQRDAVAA